jgi:cell division transport system ATP-binding protein
MSLFEAFNRVGVTVLIASHNMELISRMQHRVLVLNNGRLMSDSRETSA